jgi:hypothetical protein
MTQKYLVHYTSFKALNNILKQKAIWLCDYNGMNDGRELEHFKDKITKDLMEGFKDDLVEIKENHTKLVQVFTELIKGNVKPSNNVAELINNVKDDERYPEIRKIFGDYKYAILGEYAYKQQRIIEHQYFHYFNNYIEIRKKEIEEIYRQEKPLTAFIASFNYVENLEDAEKRHLWERYAKNGGAIIIFKKDKIEEQVKEFIEKHSFNKRVPDSHIFDTKYFYNDFVKYGNEEDNQDYKEFLKKFKVALDALIVPYKARNQEEVERKDFNNLSKEELAKKIEELKKFEYMNSRGMRTGSPEELEKFWKDVYGFFATHKDKSWEDEKEYRLVAIGAEENLIKYEDDANGRMHIEFPIIDESAIEKIIISSHYQNKLSYTQGIYRNSFESYEGFKKIEKSDIY